MSLDIPFVIQSGETRSIEQSQQKLINMYPHLVGENEKGKKQYILQSCPGLAAFASSADAEGRAIYELNEVLYVVLGNNFYSCSTAGVLNLLGTLNTSTGYVMMVGAPNEIAIIDGTNGYSYVISTGVFSTVTDADFPSTTKSIAFIDGYFICPVPDTDDFKVSALNDFKTWTALGIAAAEGSPDNLVRVFSLNRQLWLLGNKTSEVWFNSGATFPFERIEGAYAEFGCAAKYSISKAADSFMWLAKTDSGGLEVVRVKELIPLPVTTPALAYQLSTYSTVSDAEAFTYKDEGHEFYVLTFPTANKTWVYDVQENLWHERSSTISSVVSRWLPRQYAFFNNKHYCIPFNAGKVLEIDMDTYTDVGVAITRTVRSFPLYQGNNKVSLHRLVLDVEKNTGVMSGTETISLRISRDGGYNFDTARTVAAARLNDFTTEVVWRNLGIAKSWVFEFTTSDPVKWVFLGVVVDPKIAKH